MRYAFVAALLLAAGCGGNEHEQPVPDERVSATSDDGATPTRTPRGTVLPTVREASATPTDAGGTAPVMVPEVAEAVTPVVTPPPPPQAPVVTAAPQEVIVTYPDADRAALAEMVCQTFPEDRQMCEHVVWAESIGDWNPNWRCTVYGGCWSPTSDCGLMQTNVIHAGKYAALGYDINVGCWIPEVNLAVARMIYDQQGRGAWTTSR